MSKVDLTLRKSANSRSKPNCFGVCGSFSKEEKDGEEVVWGELEFVRRLEEECHLLD
jgi:hypothetical protein